MRRKTPFVELWLTRKVAVSIHVTLSGAGEDLTPETMQDVRAVINTHATSHASSPPLEVQWDDGSGTRARLKSRSLRIAASQAALTDLRALLGAERVRLVRGS